MSVSHFKRREFISVNSRWPLALCYSRLAFSASRGRVIAISSHDGAAIASPLKYRLDQLGCSEGKNLIFDFRTAEGQLERLPELAAKFVAMSSDVIERRFDMETAKAAQAAIFARLAAA